MKKNERAFLVNVMWVPLFVGIMTAALSKNPGVNPYIIAVLMGVIGMAMCYLNYKVFMKKEFSSENNVTK